MTEKEEQLKQDYDRTFNTDHGKRVLLDLMTDNHVVQAVTSIDTNTVFIQLGRRDAVLNILRKLNYTEEDFLVAVGGDE